MELEKAYDFDSQNCVWLRRGGKAFRYSDGDNVEEGIGRILSTVADKSVMSLELRVAQKDWPTTYYFSPNRANLLKPLEKTLISGARVLELGCGMGAVTRYLGETAAEVVAVEGSIRRGANAALRCQDLANVSILVDDINNLPESLGKFDVVTLIGVLEYASRYGGENAEQELLEKARSFLKDDGYLVLAIENKLGLKYLGGVPEDHLGRSFIGVTNGYGPRNVRTFSRKELVAMLEEAGFKNPLQFLSLPDYKLPITVVTPHGLQNAATGKLALGPILGNATRTFEALPMFNSGAAWQSVADAGLEQDLADSLCFVAAKNAGVKDPFPDSGLVFHYGDRTRLPQKYVKTVEIRAGESGLYVRRKNDSNPPASALDPFYQILTDEPYYEGESLFAKIRSVAMRKDWTLEEFFAAFEPWAKVLAEDADHDWNCDGKLLDFTPFNIIVDKAGVLHPFDLEWASRKRVPLAWLLYRGFRHTVRRMMPIRHSSRHNVPTFSALFSEYLKTRNIPASIPSNYDYLWWQESKFMKFIYQNPRSTMPKDFDLMYMV